MIYGRGKQRGIVLIAVLWMSALLIGFLVLVAQNSRTNAHMAQAISETSTEDVSIQSAVALIKKGLLDLKKIQGEVDAGTATTEIMSLPLWPEELEFSLVPNRGRINLKYLSTANMRRILENRQVETDQVDALIQAWTDWIDSDDNEMPRGAERDYYEGEGLPNRPANNFFQVPGEILFVRGFAGVFKDIDVNEVFTVYGKHQGVDFSAASTDTLRLIPGMTDEAIEAIIDARGSIDLSQRSELSVLLDAPVFLEVRSWITAAQAERIFTIVVYPKSESPPDYAYFEDIEIGPFWVNIKVLSVRPMARYGKY